MFVLTIFINIKLTHIFEEILGDIELLSSEGKKFYPKLEIKSVNGVLRVFKNPSKNNGSFSIDGFKSMLSSQKINSVYHWLYKKKLIKNINSSRTTNSIYFTLNDKKIRLSDHKRSSFDGIDILIKWDTTGEEIRDIISSL